jgi:predicted phage tail component-like protein
MTEATFAGVDLSDAVPEALIRRVRRGLLGERRDVYQDVPGHAGAYLFPDEPGDREVTLELNIVADTFAERRAAVVALASWADSAAAAELIIDDEADRYWEAKLVAPDSPDEWLTAADLELVFRVGPYALAVTSSSATWTAADGVDHAFTIPDDVGANPVVELHNASGSTIGSYQLVTNGVDLTDTTDLLNTQRRTISSIAYVVTAGAIPTGALAGNYNPAAVLMSGVSGDFGLLVPGSNTIRLELEGSGLSAGVVVQWRRRYRG